MTVSKAQAPKKRENLNLVGNVYNGLDFSNFPFGEKHRGYFLYVGRICIDKGVHTAIEVARYFNRPLIIAAKLDATDQDYFKSYIAPHLSDMVQWVGEVDEETRNQLYAGAICLLHPVTWPEPFGLTMIESMACGCPVVAFNDGSVPEVVSHGLSGFVANNLEEMIESVADIGRIRRKDAREYTLEKFNASRMADSYEAVYRQILSRSNKKSSSPTTQQERVGLLLEPGSGNGKRVRN